MTAATLVDETAESSVTMWAEETVASKGVRKDTKTVDKTVVLKVATKVGLMVVMMAVKRDAN